MGHVIGDGRVRLKQIDKEYDLYAVTMFCSPHHKVSEFLKENFFSIASELGYEGLIIVSEKYALEPSKKLFELIEEYDPAAANRLIDESGRYRPAVLVSDYNPFAEGIVDKLNISLIPLDGDQYERTFSDIIQTSKDKNWDRLLIDDVLKFKLENSGQLVNRVITAKPTFFGFSVDINQLVKMFYENRKRNRADHAKK